MMILKRIGERVQPWKTPSAKVERPGGKQARDVDRQVIIVAVNQADIVLGETEMPQNKQNQ